MGVACNCSDDEPLKVCEGTPAFWAPEMYMLPKGKGYSFPADIWATGVVTYMLLFGGQHPFDSDGNVSLKLLKCGEYQVGWMTSSAASSLLAWLLLPCPRQRIGASEAVNHAWFGSFGHSPGG